MTGASVYRLSAAGFLALGALALHSAAHAASAPAQARGQIRQPVTIVNTGDLDFGNVIRGATAGTVTINARTGARTRTGGTVLQGTVFRRAGFTSTGTGGRIVRYTLGSPTITLAGPGAATMTVNVFRISINGANAQTLPRNSTMPLTGTSSVNVGARLNVAANQADGDYTGSFNLTMDYQ
jgi:hypothetical protein